MEFDLTFETPADVSVELFNSIGEKIAAGAIEPMNRPTGQGVAEDAVIQRLQTGELEPGTYFLIITGPAGAVTLQSEPVTVPDSDGDGVFDVYDACPNESEPFGDGCLSTPEGLNGDVDCSGAIDTVDGLKVLRHVAGLSVAQTEPCPDLGTPFGAADNGDVNCDGDVSAVDGLGLLRHVAGLSVAQQPGCPQIGGASRAREEADRLARLQQATGILRNI
jgi:hypothetical protein